MDKKRQRKKQEKALKKRTERKLAHRRAQPGVSMAELYHIRQARQYPIEGCWIRQDWETTGLAVIVIARRQPNGLLTVGTYLVDYYCLGLKNTFCHANVPLSQFHGESLARSFPDALPVYISPPLAHEIIYGSIEYAAQFGFRPHRDFKLSQAILDPAELHPRSGTVQFGKDGKPFFIAGPNDNATEIRRQLASTAGEGNYDFLIPLGPPSEDLLMVDDDDDDDDGDAPRVPKPLSDER